jgi:hypothetical protein
VQGFVGHSGAAPSLNQPRERMPNYQGRHRRFMRQGRRVPLSSLGYQREMNTPANGGVTQAL